MNKKLLALLGIAFSAFVFFSCKEITEVSMEQIHQLQDSVARIVPGAGAVDIKVVGQTELKVIVSAPAFCAESPDKIKMAALKTGEKAMLVFGPDNAIKTGKLILTKENRQSAWDKDPADGIVTDMKIDSLREFDEVLLHFLTTMHK